MVVGDDLESAERRFFAAYTLPPAAPPPGPGAGMPVRAGRDDGQIVGLFPQPGAPR